MQNPASPPDFKRTCPTCNRPVEPGYKFCETCGTRVPELSTCSKCGTQFIAHEKYCDLCGAPFIIGEVPKPHDGPEHSEEEKTGPVEDPVSEHDDEEIPEPDTDELPEENDKENILPDEEETPHHNKEDIQEPGTVELLEQYGAEYGENETIETSREPKSDTVDDALFFSPEKRETPSKPQVNKTRFIAGCIVLIVIIAAVYFIGLPRLAESGGAEVIIPLPEPTIVRTIPPTLTETPTPVSRALIPLPTQQIPSGQKFYFQVQKNPVTLKISVIFAGSAGEGSIKSANIKVTHPDGSVTTGIIQPLKGINEIIFEGSKETDRVEIIAQMSSGETYRVYDELVPLLR